MSNEDYNQPHGCRDLFIGYAIGITLAALFCVCCSSCKTVQPITQTKDSIRVEVRHDSIYVFKHDSIFRDRWRNGDTVFVTVEKFMTLYKDKLVEVHDTIATSESVEVPVEVVPTYYKNVNRGFWVLLAILILLIGWKVVKWYFKIQTVGIL